MPLRRYPIRSVVGATRASAVALLLLFSLTCRAADDEVRTLLIDGHASGRIYDGIGALSAGASSRLLYDYPEPERSEILDYLFKPGYGASLQILKVEIGGDSNSTSGAEPSHMRAPGDLDGGRGYEWWLMKEAKKRNPDIRLWGLEWCVPGWFKGGFWSDDNIAYLLAWLRLARDQGLQIDYMGGWNERSFDMNWYAKWHRALAAEFPHVKIVGADDITDPWDVARAMLANPEFHDAIDIVGVHDPCGQRSEYRHCPVPPEVIALDKKLWDSEQSSEGHDTGAAPLARAMNRQYIDGRLTANIVWSLISAWYSSLPLADTGLMLAERPWSGYYRVGKSIWVHAHTAQFTRIGWRYIDDACGYLPDGTSYVTLKSPHSSDFTTVIETLDTKEPRTLRFETIGSFFAKTVEFWSTDLRSNNPADHFVLKETIARPEGGSFSVTLEPGHVYTLSTIQGHRGEARPSAGPGVQMPLPYREDFESYENGKLARYYSDLEGAFEVAPAAGGRPGHAYHQVVTAKPYGWNPDLLPPTTVFGDPRWWGDYEISSDALLEDDGYVELLGRVSGQRGLKVAGYHLRCGSDGTWMLYSQEMGRDDIELARGSVPFARGEWHRMTLRLAGDEIGVTVDGKTLANLRSSHHRTGQAGFAVSPWKRAQFDNVAIERTREWPTFVPQSEITATATSEHPENHRGWDYGAGNAVDDRPETSWSTEWEPRAPMPQTITLDLGKPREVSGIACQPRMDPRNYGHVNAYRVYLSPDGGTFHRVAEGRWPESSTTQTALWPAETARYLRFEVLESSAGAARIGELSVMSAAGMR